MASTPILGFGGVEDAQIRRLPPGNFCGEVGEAMGKGWHKAVVVLGMLVFSGCLAAFSGRGQERGVEDRAKASGSPTGFPKTFFLAVGKARAADPARQQERAAVAVRKVTEAAKRFQPTILVDALAETVMTREQFRRGEVRARVNGAIFRKRLERLAESATLQDTVVIYTHTHGTKASSDASASPGGLVLDPGRRRPETRGVFVWEEYAELLLKIPARNVVVLTMSCFSGGLVEHLDSPGVRERWEGRLSDEGRNLIVLTSQNKGLPSPAIVKGGEMINPFTYAVAEAFSGKADGFRLGDGGPLGPGEKDGALTMGELVDFILYTTEHTVSEAARRSNNAKPQRVGCFRREDVLLKRVGNRESVGRLGE